ncbi:triose-phosphate isomerase [Candidatus Woesearchaeota archaeon CG10_big_fil_rev_8_21_14_0_10_37_12]|nr:MAG: triose-phosphate isomerase [Candidatus Woesearchaeota archaeon CG10_big_fil_rev_8_21_14_0_10_37_12]
MIYIINFKTYETLPETIKLAKICELVAKQTKKNIVLAVPATDILAIAKNCSLPILAQHVDYFEEGRHTGSIIAENVQAAGAIGSIINHSERPIKEKQIEKTIKHLRKLGMLSVACVKTPTQAKKLAEYKPDIIAIEPPELIAGKMSVAAAKPEIITKTVHSVNVPVICGAGIHNAKDVQKALDLGAQGILISSAVVTAKNPQKVLTELLQ